MDAMVCRVPPREPEMNAADLDLTFTLTFDRAAINAAEWDTDFINERETETCRCVALEYSVDAGRVWCVMVFEREVDGLVSRERDGVDASHDQMVAEIESIDEASARRIDRQLAALKLLTERDLTPGASNTLADMAAEIRSLRELGEAGRLAAALLADRLHEDERAAGLTLAGWMR